MAEYITGTPTGYGRLAKIWHWLVVALLIVQFAIAWTMPDIRRGTTPEQLISLHLSFGLLILLVAIIRLGWRLSHPVPLIQEGTPRLQYWAARITHVLFYFALIALPLMGWAN